jgi:hypothetical protein
MHIGKCGDQRVGIANGVLPLRWRSANDADGAPRSCHAAIRDLHPTQFTVGFREIERKRLQFRAARGQARAQLLARLTIPVIVGPLGRHYVVDRHHWLRALAAEGVHSVEITVIADLHRLGHRAFWAELDRRGWCHPHDADGARRDPAEIPATIFWLRDDPFRSLASALRRVTGAVKPASLFSEFRLANALRSQLPAGLIDTDFNAALDLAVELSGAPSAPKINNSI